MKTNNNTLSLVVCIVNNGYEEQLLKISTQVGISGGTYFDAHGFSKLEADKFFGISINPEKSVILIVCPQEKIESLLKEIYKELNILSEAQGIAFTMPISNATDNLKEKLFKEKSE